MSPLRIEAREPIKIVQIKRNNEEGPSVKKLDEGGKETQIELGETYPLLPGEVLVIPDALRRAEINTNLGLRISKEPSGWLPHEEEPRYDEVSIHTTIKGYGLSGSPEDHPVLREGEPSTDSSETIQARDLKNPVTAWANNKPIATISWSKEK